MRKKVVLLALALLASASFDVAEAASQKKKARATEQKAPAEKLATPADSLSYAAGMTLTDGLLPFLKSSYGIETSQLGAVEEVFKATMATGITSEIRARIAGQQVAYMVMERMLPKMKKDMEGSRDSLNMQLFTNGFASGMKKDYTTMADTTASKYFNKTMKQIKDDRNAAMRKEGEDFLAANAKREGVVTLPSGLQYETLTMGTGTVAEADDQVTVKYEGNLLDGTVFDSSYNRGDGTAKFRPNQVIKGWKEALTMMPVGSKWKLYIPYNLAYGERGTGKIKPYSALVFTVEVVNVEKKQTKTEAAKTSSTGQKTAAKTTNNQEKKSK